MSKADTSTTVVIKRAAKVATDNRGRTVWVDEVEDAEFDLMSSQELRLALLAADDSDRESIRAAAECGTEGVVARDRATGLYEIISEAQLEELMSVDKDLAASIRRCESVPELVDDAGENGLSLVSTQTLSRMLNHDEFDDMADAEEDNRGVNPYDRG